MMTEILRLSLSLIESSIQHKKRKGEVDALMISLAGVVMLAIIALIFVMVVGTSLDGAKDAICDKVTTEGEGATKIIGYGAKFFAGCG